MSRPDLYRAAAFAVAILFAGTQRQALSQEPKDILYYGNSFTIATGFGSSRSVPELISSVAVAAGHPAPRNRNASSAGQTLQWHLTNNVGVINTGIAAGQQWDYVVLQDYSTWPTHIGNLSQHLSSSLALYQKVALHSPYVIPVMYETWARGPGHDFYMPPVVEFPGGPAQMQQELRDGYMNSAWNINYAVGTQTSRYAPVGDAWEDGGFPLNFYASDRYHAANRGTLLNALVLYGTIYEDRTTSDINLSSILTTLNLSAADGALLTSLADGVLIPEPTGAGLAALAFAALALSRRGRS